MDAARALSAPDPDRRRGLATIEPTDAQVTLLRVVAVVFGLVGLAMALGGPFALLRF